VGLAAHQQLIFNVARAYFTLAGADAALRAARQGLSDAQVVQQSAESLFSRGLNTIVDVQLARRATAQAQYDLAQATTAQHDTMYTLLAAMDLAPTTKLRAADASARPLPTRTARTVDEVLSDALRQRPDLLANVAKLRASDAEIAAARSALFPKVSLSANVQGNIGRLSVDNSPYLPVSRPQGAAPLNFESPLYEGGLLQNKLSLAQSKREEGAATLKERTDQALREVALAYDQVDTGLQQYDAAVAPADRIQRRLPHRQGFLCARCRHVDRRDLCADGARHSARRTGPGTHAVADQRSGARLCDRRADLEYRLRPRDTAVMLVRGTGRFLAFADEVNGRIGALLTVSVACNERRLRGGRYPGLMIARVRPRG
jgi:hypothetical protein